MYFKTNRQYGGPTNFTQATQARTVGPQVYLPPPSPPIHFITKTGEEKFYQKERIVGRDTTSVIFRREQMLQPPQFNSPPAQLGHNLSLRNLNTYSAIQFKETVGENRLFSRVGKKSLGMSQVKPEIKQLQSQFFQKGNSLFERPKLEEGKKLGQTFPTNPSTVTSPFNRATELNSTEYGSKSAFTPQDYQLSTLSQEKQNYLCDQLRSKQRLLQDYQSQIVRLHRQLTIYKESQQKWLRENTQLREFFDKSSQKKWIKEAASAKQAAESMNSELRQQVGKLLQQVENADRQLKGKGELIKYLQTQCNRHKNDYESNLKLQDELNAKYELQKAQNDKLKKKVSQSQSDCKILKEYIQHSQKQSLKKIENSQKSFGEKFREQQSSATYWQALAENEVLKLRQLTKTYQEDSREMNVMVMKLQAFQTKIQLQNKLCGDLSRKNGQLQKNVHQLKQQLLQRKILQQINAQMAVEKQRLSNDIKQLKKIINNKEGELQVSKSLMDVQLKQKQRILNQFQEKEHGLRLLIQNGGRREAALKIQKQNLNVRCVKIVEENIELKKNISKMKQQYSQILKKCHEVEESRNGWKEKLEIAYNSNIISHNILQEKNKEVGILCDQNTRIKSQLERFREQAEYYRKNLQKLTYENKNIIAQMVKLQGQLKEYEGGRQASISQIHEFEQQRLKMDNLLQNIGSQLKQKTRENLILKDEILKHQEKIGLLENNLRQNSGWQNHYMQSSRRIRFLQQEKLSYQSRLRKLQEDYNDYKFNNQMETKTLRDQIQLKKQAILQNQERYTQKLHIYQVENQQNAATIKRLQQKIEDFKKIIRQKEIQMQGILVKYEQKNELAKLYEKKDGQKQKWMKQNSNYVIALQQIVKQLQEKIKQKQQQLERKGQSQQFINLDQKQMQRVIKPYYQQLAESIETIKQLNEWKSVAKERQEQYIIQINILQEQNDINIKQIELLRGSMKNKTQEIDKYRTEMKIKQGHWKQQINKKKEIIEQEIVLSADKEALLMEQIKSLNEYQNEMTQQKTLLSQQIEKLRYQVAVLNEMKNEDSKAQIRFQGKKIEKGDEQIQGYKLQPIISIYEGQQSQIDIKMLDVGSKQVQKEEGVDLALDLHVYVQKLRGQLEQNQKTIRMKQADIANLKEFIDEYQKREEGKQFENEQEQIVKIQGQKDELIEKISILQEKILVLNVSQQKNMKKIKSLQEQYTQQSHRITSLENQKTLLQKLRIEEGQKHKITLINLQKKCDELSALLLQYASKSSSQFVSKIDQPKCKSQANLEISQGQGEERGDYSPKAQVQYFEVDKSALVYISLLLNIEVVEGQILNNIITKIQSLMREVEGSGAVSDLSSELKKINQNYGQLLELFGIQVVQGKDEHQALLGEINSFRDNIQMLIGKVKEMEERQEKLIRSNMYLAGELSIQGKKSEGLSCETEILSVLNDELTEEILQQQFRMLNCKMKMKEQTNEMMKGSKTVPSDNSGKSEQPKASKIWKMRGQEQLKQNHQQKDLQVKWEERSSNEYSEDYELEEMEEQLKVKQRDFIQNVGNMNEENSKSLASEQLELLDEIS